MRPLFAFLAMFVFFSWPVWGLEVSYDLIVVRSDLPYDWSVAQAYSQQAKIPIIATYPDWLDVSAREQLSSFNDAGHTNVLVLGGENAISPAIESELVDKGFITHRIREVDRYGTASRVAVELYEKSETAVIVNAESVDGLLNAQMAAFISGSPILFSKGNDIPQSVREALRLLETEKLILIPSGFSEEIKEELRSEFKIYEYPTDLGKDDAISGLRLIDIAIGLVLGVLLALVFKPKIRLGGVPYNVLTEDEEKILRAIESGGGELKQDTLYELTGFSRPKISRLVSELVERNLIEKTQFKKTFILKIKKELSKT